MMKTIVIAISVVALLGLIAGNALAAGDENGGGKAQTTCPVMGGKIDKQYFADYEGKRVYFCCPACSATFNADPDKYIKQLEDAGVALAKTPVPQTVCPNTGKPIDKQYFADYEGKRVYFCGPGCLKAFKADPEPTMEKLAAAGITLAVPQTVCPNTGKPIDKDYFADYEGKRVYFCGPGCLKAFKADPEPTMRKLAEEGITLEDTPKAEAQMWTCSMHPDVKQGKPGKCPKCGMDLVPLKSEEKAPAADTAPEVKVQTYCPIMTRNKINKKYFADYDGKRVYFCCPVCRRKFKKDPATWVKKLEDEGITLETAPGAE